MSKVLKENLDLWVLLGRTAGRVLQAPSESEGSLGAWVSQAPKVAVVTLGNLEKQEMLVFLGKGELLEKMVKLALLVLWALRAWLGREENRALPAPLAFRGFLVLQVLLGKVESQVIKEFLEILE